MHLAGNPDTRYKEEVLKILEELSPHARETGSMRLQTTEAEPASAMSLRILFDNRYLEEFENLLKEQS